MLFAGIRNNLFTRNSRIAVVILLCVYAYMCSMHVVDAINTGINLFEYLLVCITDHNYLIYALLFYLVIDSAIRIKTVLETAKIRYGTLHNYYCSLIIERTISIITLVVVHLLIPFVMGVAKLEFNVSYSITSIGDGINSNYEVIYALANLIPNSAFATFCVAAYLCFGISFISDVFALSYEIWNKKGFVVSVAFILLNTFTGFMTDLDEGIFKLLFANDYFIFHHGLIYNRLWCFAIYVIIMLIVVFALYKTAIKNNSNHVRKNSSYIRKLLSSPWLIISFYTVYFGLVLTISIGNGAFSWQLLKGFSYRGFYLIELLFYIAPIVFSLFLINMEWENELRNKNILALIRYGKRYKWEREKSKCEICFIAVNVLIVGTVSVLSIVFSASGLDDTIEELTQFYCVNFEQFIFRSILSVIFRSIEWFFFYVFDRYIFKLTNNTVASYLVSLSLIMIGFLMPTFNPIGKGSLYQLLELDGDNLSFMIALFFVELLVIVFSENYQNQKKEKYFHGISNQIRKCI